MFSTWLLAGCGLVLDVDPRAQDAGTASDLDAGRRADALGADATGLDAAGVDAEARDAAGVDATRADSGLRATDGSVTVVDASVGPCGAEPLEITTAPPYLSIGLGEFVYDADSSSTSGETWLLSTAPAGMTVDSAGVVRWMPPTLGSSTVVLEVFDGCGEHADQTFTLLVRTGFLNGLDPRAVTDSALAKSAPARAALAGAPLRNLVHGELVRSTREEPRSIELLRAFVRCALPEGEVIDVDGHALHGEIGLAPEWSRAPCDEECRAWVSACTLALVNPGGERVTVTLSAGTSAESEAEGAYFGDLFADPPIARACRGLAPRERLGSRTCTLADPRCPVELTGPCTDLPDGSRRRAVTVLLD